MLGNFFDEKNGVLTIILMGFPCNWNSCHHCYFNEESSTDESLLLRQNFEILNGSIELLETNEVKFLKIFNGGSFFELPKQLYPIFKIIFNNREISIESRPELITESSIRHLQLELNPKILNIFIGFDSYNEILRNKTLNKGIPQSEITRISSIKIKNAFFYSYVVFGIEGITEVSVMKSVEEFNSIFKGVTAIEFRFHPGLKIKPQVTSYRLKNWLISNCSTVDFLGCDDDQWEIK